MGISQGVRFNAEKKHIGIFQLKFGNLYLNVIYNQDYSCVTGCCWTESSLLFYPKKKLNLIKKEKKVIKNLNNLPKKKKNTFFEKNNSIFALKLTKNGKY